MLDEEATQVKAINFLADSEILGLRILVLPEEAHPRWGAFNRAMDKSGLRGTALKGTSVANHYRGPFKSGANDITASDCLSMRLRDCATPEWLEQRAEPVAFDKQSSSVASPEDQLQEWYDYLACPRPQFVMTLASTSLPLQSLMATPIK